MSNDNTHEHYFYHDDGFIIKSDDLDEPIKLPDNCCTNFKDCNIVYQGMEPRDQDYYDMCSGGWKVEYFKNNIY